MKRSEATHFIEQYNTVSPINPQHHFTPINSIRFLEPFLKKTDQLKSFKTVAIFFIKLKK